MQLLIQNHVPLIEHVFHSLDIFLLKDTGSKYEYVNDDARKEWPLNSTTLWSIRSSNRCHFRSSNRIVVLVEGEESQILIGMTHYGKDWSECCLARIGTIICTENVPNLHVSLNEDKSRRPARHSKVQRPTALLQCMMNSSRRITYRTTRHSVLMNKKDQLIRFDRYCFILSTANG